MRLRVGEALPKDLDNSPFQRTTTVIVPTLSHSQLLPVQADILITLALLLGDANSQTSAAAMTALLGFHFVTFLATLSLPLFGRHEHPGSTFISHYGAASLTS